MILKQEYYKWTQVLDYVNTTFHCQIYQQTWHIQDTCIIVQAHPSRRKGTKPKPKCYKFTEQLKPDGEGNQGEELQQTTYSEKSMISI